MPINYSENYWVWVTRPVNYLDRVVTTKGQKDRTIENEESLKHKFGNKKSIRGRILDKSKIKYVDRRDLDPKNDFTGRWWTCHKDTKKGDLALLYRAGKYGGKTYQDIKYLFRATTDAYLGEDFIEDFNEFKDPGWDYVCDFESIYKFNKSLKYIEMKKSDHYPNLRHWGALNGRFHRLVYRIGDSEFEYLIKILTKRNPAFQNYKKTIKSLKKI